MPFLVELCPAASSMPMRMDMPAHMHHQSGSHGHFENCPFGSAPAGGPAPTFSGLGSLPPPDQKPLHGETAEERALTAMWERPVEQEGFASVMEAIRNTAPGLKGRAIAGPHGYDQIPALADRSKQRVKNFFADLDARLQAVPFVAGEHFSIADITALVTVDFAAKAINVPLPDEHAAVRRWYELVSKRPSASA
jgi:glutathione S-transferase